MNFETTTSLMTHQKEAVAKMIPTRIGALFMDMGRGLVGKHAFLNGKQFVGTELNPKRLAVLVDFIERYNNAPK